MSSLLSLYIEVRRGPQEKEGVDRELDGHPADKLKMRTIIIVVRIELGFVTKQESLNAKDFHMGSSGGAGTAILF